MGEYVNKVNSNGETSERAKSLRESAERMVVSTAISCLGVILLLLSTIKALPDMLYFIGLPTVTAGVVLSVFIVTRKTFTRI